MPGGVTHALTCIGPATKEMTRHYIREPLVEGLADDPELDLIGVVFVGSPQVNDEKMWVSERLGTMTKVNSINTSSQTVTLKLVGGKTATGADASTTTYTVKDADNDNYAALAKMAKDDYVMITVAGTTVESIKTPTVVTGKISAVAVKSDAVTPNGVTVSGTAYKLTNTFSSKDQLVKGSVSTTVSSTAYVDTYGYVIYMPRGLPYLPQNLASSPLSACPPVLPSVR